MKRRCLHVSLLLTSVVYLPAINKTLPNNWCAESTRADMTAKRDDAAVPIHFWNKRITTVFKIPQWYRTQQNKPEFLSIEVFLPVFRHVILGCGFSNISILNFEHMC